MNARIVDFFESNIEDFISDLDRSEITKKSYRTILLKFSLYLRSNNIDTPKSRNLIEYKEYLSKSISAVSIQKVIVVLRGFFHYLARNEIYPDISVGINSMKLTKTMKRDLLTVDDVLKLLKIAEEESERSIESYRNYVILSLLATTGLRTIEVERNI